MRHEGVERMIAGDGVEGSLGTQALPRPSMAHMITMEGERGWAACLSQGCKCNDGSADIRIRFMF